MSVRSIRACDYPECDAISTLTCPLCERDCCRTHAGDRWIGWAVLSGTNATREGSPNANCIGASKRINVCSECQATLSMHSVAPGFFSAYAPLSATIPSDEPLIAAARAYIAEAKLKQG